MKIEGRRTFAAGPETLWSLLHNPDVLKRVLPDCDMLEAVAPDEFKLTLNTRIGRDIEHLTGVMHIDRVTPCQGFDFEAESENRPGYLYARGRVSLEPEGAGATTLIYEAEIEPRGRFARISPRLMQTTMNAIARRSLEALEFEVALRTGTFTTALTSPAAVIAARSTEIYDLVSFLRRLLTIALALLGIVLIVRGLGRRRAQPVAGQDIGVPVRIPDELPILSPDAPVWSRV